MTYEQTKKLMELFQHRESLQKDKERLMDLSRSVPGTTVMLEYRVNGFPMNFAVHPERLISLIREAQTATDNLIKDAGGTP